MFLRPPGGCPDGPAMASAIWVPTTRPCRVRRRHQRVPTTRLVVGWRCVPSPCALRLSVRAGGACRRVDVAPPCQSSSSLMSAPGTLPSEWATARGPRQQLGSGPAQPSSRDAPPPGRCATVQGLAPKALSCTDNGIGDDLPDTHDRAATACRSRGARSCRGEGSTGCRYDSGRPRRAKRGLAPDVDRDRAGSCELHHRGAARDRACGQCPAWATGPGSLRRRAYR